MVAATLGNTAGSLIAYAIGAWGGRPFLERYGRYLLIRPHEIALAERFFDRWGAPTAFLSRLLPIVRTFISFPAGVARMPLAEVHRLLDGRGVPLVDPVAVRRHRARRNWVDIRKTLQPFDLVIAVVVVLGVVAFVWWRLGMPGRPSRRPSSP